ncbi:hypothetical protein PENSPDRAFT_647380 [Peniophora sp. CONT]|nr:hypothetical protein PENSPDRAFT_647380 [Peniophora sp. CONT]
MAGKLGFAKHWFAIEAIPIYMIVGGTIAGAGIYLGRLARGPHVVWSNANPQPWNSVRENDKVKMMAINQDFNQKWSRGRKNTVTGV